MKKKSDGNKILRNTVQASNFFNFKDIVETCKVWILNIRFNYFNAVPNILTGIGIFGTFVGIVEGLNASNFSEASSNMDNIGPFIIGLKKAFGTSICGLFFSMIFVFFEKILIDNVEYSINRLSHEVDRLFKRKVEQDYLIDIERSLDEQNGTLKRLASEIGEQVVKSFSGMGVNKIDVQESVRDGISKGFQSLYENLTHLNEAHEAYLESARLIIDESKSVGLAVTYLNKAVRGYSEGVEITSKKFEDASSNFEQVTKQQIDQIESFEQIAKKYVDQIEGFEKTSKNIIDAAEISQKNIDSLTDTQNTVLSSIEKTKFELYKMCKNFSELVDEYNSKTNEYMINTFKIFDEKLYKLVNEYDSKVNESISNTFKTFDEELSKAVVILGRGTNQISEQIDFAIHSLGKLREFIESIEEKEVKPNELKSVR